MNEIMQTPELLKELSDGVLECAPYFHWDRREEFWNKIYDQAISNYKEKITATSSLNS